MGKLVVKAILAILVEEIARLLLTPFYGWVWLLLLLHLGWELFTWMRIHRWFAQRSHSTRAVTFAAVAYIAAAGAMAYMLHQAANSPDRLAATKSDIAVFEQRITETIHEQQDQRSRNDGEILLSPVLVVDSLSRDDTAFHIRIKNVGPADLVEPYIAVTTPSYGQWDTIPLGRRNVAPNQELHVNGPRWIDFSTDRSVVLMVSFEHPSEGRQAVRFAFILPSGDNIVGEEFAPSASNVESNDIVMDGRANMLQAALDETKGAITMVVLETAASNRGDTVFLTGGEKLFIVDTRRHYAIFTGRDGVPLSVRFESGEAHFVALAWDEDGPAYLQVGKEKVGEVKP